MGFCNIMFAFLTALVAVNFIFAEESSYLAPDEEYASDEKSPSKETENPKKNGSSHHNSHHDNHHHHHDNHHNHHHDNKTAFNNCTNYCLNCRQALLCKADHRAVVRTCSGRLRNCVEGKCSSNRSQECSN